MAGNSGQVERIPKRGQFPTSDSLDTATANLRCAAALVAALFDAGVRHAVISSGSRCAPLVQAAGHHEGLRIWTNPDERSAGFFALGAAKASRQPVALICTSGTAAANYFPAVIEARMSGIPLIVITADRPPRLRGVGSPQTIDQIHLYGKHPVYFEDLSVPDSEPLRVQQWARAADEAVFRAISLGGPAHLNAPFDEPLLLPLAKAGSALAEGRGAAKSFVASKSRSDTPRADVSEIVSLLSNAQRPVIVCGPADDDQLARAVAALAVQIGAPILADIASQVRRDPNTISCHDLFLRDQDGALTPVPDLILQLGQLPTSKVLNEWIASSSAKTKIGIALHSVADPQQCLTHTILADPVSTLQTLLRVVQPRPSSDYCSLWKRFDDVARAAIAEIDSAGSEIAESDIVARACETAGPDSILFLSNSMPIRWADMYARAGAHLPRILVNRGANGIDGIISTAAGAARATGQTTICILGDLTFLHDQNGLWKLKSNEVPLKIILLNNDGGGIFHFLPVATRLEQFESHVAMPHGIDMKYLAEAHGIPHHRVDSAESFSTVLAQSLNRTGPEVIEIRTNRDYNLGHHQDIVRKVAHAVRSLGVNP